MVANRSLVRWQRVHPHSRGENPLKTRLRLRQQGSSPLAWGKWAEVVLLPWGHGFIPTRVGKIRTIGSRRGGGRVHPHSRGENNAWPSCIASRTGSSPLARGKFATDDQTDETPRFIPTRAGKIAWLQNKGRAEGVHPHSRGENTVEGAKGLWEDGSSPLARGKSLRWSWRPL